MIVLSKIDKLRQSEIQKTINKAKNDFFWLEVVPYSSLKKTGHKEMIKAIFWGINDK
jgi:GTP-binding protein EngB required for normal cell division